MPREAYPNRVSKRCTVCRGESVPWGEIIAAHCVCLCLVRCLLVYEHAVAPSQGSLSRSSSPRSAPGGLTAVSAPAHTEELTTV
eukprot:SAG22_NODE_13_length_33548_cov_57.167773_30_plen_84_part_00